MKVHYFQHYKLKWVPKCDSSKVTHVHKSFIAPLIQCLMQLHAMINAHLNAMKAQKYSTFTAPKWWYNRTSTAMNIAINCDEKRHSTFNVMILLHFKCGLHVALSSNGGRNGPKQSKSEMCRHNPSPVHHRWGAKWDYDDKFLTYDCLGFRYRHVQITE